MHFNSPIVSRTNDVVYNVGRAMISISIPMAIAIPIPIPIVARNRLAVRWLPPTLETVAMRRVIVPGERLMRRRGLTVGSRPRSMPIVIYFAGMPG